VSRFAARVPGAGGFINITQNAKSLVFAGTFTAGGIDVEVRDGKLTIRKEGQFRKFVKAVAHRTFVGARSLKDQQSVLYVTERCVFRLTHQGLELIEVAPGIDIRRDILENMDFEPIVRDPVQMNSALFVEGRMNLRAIALSSGA
jgi:propionate CoA-transferase